MKVSKDNVVGAVFMLIVVSAVIWAYLLSAQVRATAVRVERVTTAHDNLVAVLNPVLQQIQVANQQIQRATAQSQKQEQPAGTGSAIRQ